MKWELWKTYRQTHACGSLMAPVVMVVGGEG